MLLSINASKNTLEIVGCLGENRFSNIDGSKV